MNTVLWLCPSLPTETLKWLSSLPILMQESFWWWQYSDRYIISLSPHLHTPFPPISPSLISRTVSVDVKHHVYLFTSPRRCVVKTVMSDMDGVRVCDEWSLARFVEYYLLSNTRFMLMLCSSVAVVKINIVNRMKYHGCDMHMMLREREWVHECMYESMPCVIAVGSHACMYEWGVPVVISNKTTTSNSKDRSFPRHVTSIKILITWFLKCSFLLTPYMLEWLLWPCRNKVWLGFSGGIFVCFVFGFGMLVCCCLSVFAIVFNHFISGLLQLWWWCWIIFF